MELLPFVQAGLDRFTNGAEQADDITMLALDWYGAEASPDKC